MSFNRLYLILLLTAAVTSSCNKDDVIEQEKPSDGRRPITSTSSAYQSRVFEYTPAPGQFINETKSAGFTGAETTPQLAAEYAAGRLSEKKYVSLGSFGGYIVIGFDHSIVNSRNGYDFLIQGNAFDSDQGGSSEPGIVWVMQDTDRNGLPDDVWYELKGSEYGKAETLTGYSVTYYRPDSPKKPVRWTDSEGNSGTVDYLKAYHTQDYYYPAWISADSYTLTGTRLAPRNVQDPETGFWANNPYGWGYADNMGSDVIDGDGLTGAGQLNGFKISNAVDAGGNAVDLPYIDFVKVQTAVLAESGWLGENSCEVFSFIDNNMERR